MAMRNFTFRGFRKKLRSLFLGKRDGKPIIMTEWGPVTESARLQAAKNMRDDPAYMDRVLRILAKEKGSLAAALVEAKRRYPEAFEEDK